ncbi:hypothetical protein EDB92DRAFT_2113825 [Lactarius akahatsu]|uniref:Uncharacterized protein n=1 Tax=Lactarius akahatsu TaxID=416441 RepID=A0AAD4LIW5_9AGAM|nr:hypothetical protein EDB92DRAFT_2113825 [Lactarius akahatsu]
MSFAMVVLRKELENLEARIPVKSATERFLPTVPCPSPCVPRKPDLPTVQRLAQSSHVISGRLSTDDVEASVAADAADADLLLGSTDESDRPFLPPDRTPFTTGTHNTEGDTASEPVLLQRRTALWVELAAQSVQMAGQLRRNAEHVSGALAAGEKADANLDVMKRERVRLRDHRGKALGTTRLRCRASSLLRLRFWSCSSSFGSDGAMGAGRWPCRKPVTFSSY